MPRLSTLLGDESLQTASTPARFHARGPGRLCLCSDPFRVFHLAGLTTLVSCSLHLTLLCVRHFGALILVMATSSSDLPARSASTQNAITLHILSPAPEVTGGHITFSSISLDTTILQLKARLQNSITAAPPPERQRLIYRGRALVDGGLTLRKVFQSEVG